MGGYIALAFAEKYSFMLNAFGFVHSTAYADNEEKKANRKKGIDLMERFGAHAFIKNTTPNLFSAEFKEQHREQVETLIERGKQFSKESLQKYYRAMMNRPDRTHVLTSSTVPVLFILGTEDIAAPMNDLLQQVQLPEVAYIYILKDAGHMGMWESSLKVNEGLLYFLSDVL
jgi:pimeloyl-ACP methyl ester carboxylesterase